MSNYHSGNCITMTGFFYFWNWLEKVKEKKNKKITKKRQRREEWGTLRRPFLTKPRERKTFLNLSVRGLSLSLTVFLCLSLPPPCRPLSWRLWKMSGHGLAEDEGLWTRAAGGEWGRGRTMFSEVFRHHICLTFLTISKKFSHSSWSRAPPLTAFIVTLLDFFKWIALFQPLLSAT